MKHWAILGLFLSLISCGEKKNAEEENVYYVEPKAPSEEVSGDKTLVGYGLIQSSDCMSCHRDNGKMIGPSYAEISAKYTKQDAQILATKIVEGSVGVWGQVPMPAHPSLSKEDATKMVEYILSMKK